MSQTDDAPPEPSDDRGAELDGVRIRQLASLRRAAYRSRSHAVIAMLLCAVAVIQAGILLVEHLRHFGFGARAALYAAFVLVGGYGAIFFARRAIALQREAKQSRLETPDVAPDFSTLSDGSQRWQNLEELK